MMSLVVTNFVLPSSFHRVSYGVSGIALCQFLRIFLLTFKYDKMLVIFVHCPNIHIQGH